MTLFSSFARLSILSLKHWCEIRIILCNRLSTLSVQNESMSHMLLCPFLLWILLRISKGEGTGLSSYWTSNTGARWSESPTECSSTNEQETTVVRGAIRLRSYDYVTESRCVWGGITFFRRRYHQGSYPILFLYFIQAPFSFNICDYWNYFN